jgi:hypothetical protein
MDTTIKVDSKVRDRLAVLARENGTTIRDLVAELAGAKPTKEEIEAQHSAVTEYIRRHFVPDFNDEDVAAGKKMLEDLAAGRLKVIG